MSDVGRVARSLAIGTLVVAVGILMPGLHLVVGLFAPLIGGFVAGRLRGNEASDCWRAWWLESRAVCCSRAWVTCRSHRERHGSSECPPARTLGS